MADGRKIKLKKRYWLLAGLGLLLLLLLLVVLVNYQPSGYHRAERIHDKQISPYLTHHLLPQLYNGSQLREPFEVVAVQEGVNDIIGRANWSTEVQGVSFSSPRLCFVPDAIVLMAAANVVGADVVVTVVVEPSFDRHGLLNLTVSKVKVGAVNVTFFARMAAKRMYAKQLSGLDPAKKGSEIGMKILASLLDSEPFSPVFELDGNKVRVSKITIAAQKLTVGFAPASQ